VQRRVAPDQAEPPAPPRPRHGAPARASGPMNIATGDGGGFRLPPLAAYVHIPWCVRKCPYCDFNSHAAGPQLPEREYVDAVLAELELQLEDRKSTRLNSSHVKSSYAVSCL